VVRVSTRGARRALQIPASVEHLAEVRAFVRDCVAEFGGTKRVADDLVQAVDEATCNVMLHGYKSQPGDIDLEASLRDRKIQIRILDRTPTFDPTTAPSRDADAGPVPTRIGGMGLGIELLRGLTDEVHHSVRPDGGNELTLVRSIDGRTQEE
jgi:anti-sigma regulatory factor (Ser/Thr protein kinase)